MPDFLFFRKIIILAQLCVCLLLPPPLLAADQITLASRQDSPLNAITEKVLEEAYRRIGIKVTFERFAGDRSIFLANKGVLDGEVSRLRFVLQNYTNLRLVPVPIFYSEIVAFTIKPGIIIESWESLAAYRVAFPASFRLIGNHLKSHPHTLKTADTSSALEALFQDKVEVAVANRYEGERLIDVFGYRGVHTQLPPLESKPIFHLLHEKNASLIPSLTKALETMTEDGTLKRIWNEKGWARVETPESR